MVISELEHFCLVPESHYT